MKKYFILLIVSLYQGVWASPYKFERLVSEDPLGYFQVQPWFQSIQPDLLHLIKRSYVVTKRQSLYQFIHKERLLYGDPRFTISENGHRWYCDRNFTGIHGHIEQNSYFRKLLSCCLECWTRGNFSAEIDFPGFVALMRPNVNYCPHYLIAVVFRGSQGEDFQPGAGMLGASWATNYDAAPEAIDSENFGLEGLVHGGYLEKFRSCNISQEQLATQVEEGEIVNPLPLQPNLDFIYPMNQSIERIIAMVPEAERSKIRFIVTGHSQGGGLAQVAFPYLIHRFGGDIPGFLNNRETPRFFAYFLSAPCIAADQETADNYSNFVGHDQMINHSAFRDIVPMAHLGGYVSLGHLALDSAYDVLYRGICSEIAYNNRMCLMQFFQKHMDEDQFDITNDNYWIYKNMPELIIDWKEIKSMLSHIHSDSAYITQDNMLEILNTALKRHRKKRRIISEEYFNEMHFIFNRDLDWERIREVCRGDLFAEEVVLDEERCRILQQIENHISGETANFFQGGYFNTATLIDTALDLLEAPRSSFCRENCWEYLRRIFCCSCCCGDEFEAHTSFFFDPEFYNLIYEGMSDFSNNRDQYAITPLGKISLVAYLHYGTGACCGSGGKSFDKSLPSRNLGHALENGRISKQEATSILNSELSI